MIWWVAYLLGATFTAGMCESQKVGPQSVVIVLLWPTALLFYLGQRAGKALQ